MPRYKPHSQEQGVLVNISFSNQIKPDTFEFALNHIVDHELDLSVFDARFRNDETGAPAFDPRVLLKVVLYGYARGLTSSREIAQACVENVVFMALSGDSRPHFTTVADFIAGVKDGIEGLFLQVLMICWTEGLIGNELFAVDGCKISSNCSKEWSGTREDFERKRKKIERTVRFLTGKHRMSDQRELSSKQAERVKKTVQNLRSKAKKIKEFMANNDDRKGSSGSPVKSNITDNDSTKMSGSHGVVQGYNAQAMVDSKHQVITAAKAYGVPVDVSLLEPMVEETRATMEKAGISENIFAEAQLLADAGYHSEKNMEILEEQEIDAYIADKNFRKRDLLFPDTAHHRRTTANWKNKPKRSKFYTSDDFKLDKETGKLICPAGNQLYVAFRNFVDKKGNKGTIYKGWKTKCRSCHLRPKCIRGKKTLHRAVLKYSSKAGVRQCTKRMIEKIDTEQGRQKYSRRIAIVEPVFANITSTLGLDRFTLRGKDKVDSQWKLFAILHNMKKIWRYAPAFD